MYRTLTLVLIVVPNLRTHLLAATNISVASDLYSAYGIFFLPRLLSESSTAGKSEHVPPKLTYNEIIHSITEYGKQREVNIII